MGWSIGFDTNWNRDIGYGVPAYCDHPGCMAEIDRGLSYVCGGQPYGGEHGCGLYFCEKHMGLHVGGGRQNLPSQVCERCGARLFGHRKTDPFIPTPDHPEWIQHKLTDPSWAAWRAENPAAVEALSLTLCAKP